jgi:hypothetical protein
MATNTYVALDKVTISGTSTNTITFSSIPATYTDLEIVFNGGVNTGTANILIQFNGDTTTNYSYTQLTGDGGTAQSYRGSTTSSILSNYWGYPTADNNTNMLFKVMNYANTTTFKTVLTRSNNAANGTSAVVGLWRKTPEAINSVTLFTSANNFANGSTFSLYGIASAEVGAKATGGVISSDASYWYHTFLANGTFTPTQSLSCDYLIVAGGGGGGTRGGGGAGGFRTATAQSLTTTAYTVTVGAGGAINANGADSVFN